MRKKLLLADDSITIQKVVELTFPTDEFEVVTAGNGRIAVDKAMTFLPDIVLCDVIMPQLDGYQVCEALRASAALKDVPILLLNGAFEPYDEARAKAVGALGNVSKPFDPPALVARVKEILAARSVAAPEPISAEVASLDSLPAIVMPPDDDDEALAPIPEPEAEAEAEPVLDELEPDEPQSVGTEDFTYDDSGTRPVSTMEVPSDVRELAARSLSMDAPVFATVEPDVLIGPETIEAPDDEPSDLSQTLHDGLDESLNTELPELETSGETAPMEIDVPEVGVEEPASVDFEPEDAASVDDARDATDSDAIPLAPPAAEAMHGTEREQEFEPHDFELPPDQGSQSPESGADQTVSADGADALEPLPSVIEPDPEPAAVVDPETGPDPVSLEIPRPTHVASPNLADSGLADLPDFEEPPPEVAEPAETVAPVAAAEPATSEAVAVPVDMVQQIAQRVISQVSERVIREIAWDVIPGLAEKLIKAEVERIKARAESEHD